MWNDTLSLTHAKSEFPSSRDRPEHFGLTSGHRECCFMIKSKPADNLPEHIAGSTCAFSLYLDTWSMDQ